MVGSNHDTTRSPNSNSLFYANNNISTLARPSPFTQRSTMAGVKGLGAAKTYDGAPLRIGIVHARWNTRIIDALLSGTVSALRASGVKEENLVIQSVPGSYELPYAVHRMYVASQTQAAASSAGGVGGALLGSATDLLGGSATDLTKLPTGKKEGSAATASAGKGESEVGKEGAKQPFDASCVMVRPHH